MKMLLSHATLLVGIDFSEGSEHALRHAVDVAEQNQASLELVHVIESEWPALPAADPFPSGDTTSAWWKALSGHARSFLGRLGLFCSHFVADRVPAEVRVLIGNPAMGLQKTAEQTGAAGIVLGKHGRRAPSQRAVGSTAMQVFTSSPIPVYLISAPKLAPLPTDSFQAVPTSRAPLMQPGILVS